MTRLVVIRDKHSTLGAVRQQTHGDEVGCSIATRVALCDDRHNRNATRWDSQGSDERDTGQCSRAQHMFLWNRSREPIHGRTPRLPIQQVRSSASSTPCANQHAGEPHDRNSLANLIPAASSCIFCQSGARDPWWRVTAGYRQVGLQVHDRAAQ